MNNSEVGYTDGDVMIIDNVRHLEEQYQRLPSQNLIILCCKGRMQLDMNGRTLRFGENEVLFSSPGAMLSGFMFSADFDCKILCLQVCYPLVNTSSGLSACCIFKFPLIELLKICHDNLPFPPDTYLFQTLLIYGRSKKNPPG